MNVLLSFLDASLGCVVEDVIFPGCRSRLLKRLVCLLLLPSYHLQFSRQHRKYLRHTDAIHTEVFEQWRERRQRVLVADFVQFVKEHHKTLVCGTVQSLHKFLHVKPHCFSYLLRRLEQFHDGTGQSRSRHLHLLAIRVQRGTECQDLRNSHVCLCTHTS